MRVLALHGPNLNLLGKREPGIYGAETLEQIVEQLKAFARERGVEIDSFQSNEEGVLVTRIGEAPGTYDGILFNPAAYTHTSVALRDALMAVDVPCVEVHLSHVPSREDFRQKSLTAPACIGVVTGFGGASYRLALDGLLDYIRKNSK
ncbi:MAG: type II 3-dehydroquinate dehydratase [Spartobacteria bacterium]|nr:type II 3-dehydroquinate dehydratase [Spartobacteria bacterium]